MSWFTPAQQGKSSAGVKGGYTKIQWEISKASSHSGIVRVEEHRIHVLIDSGSQRIYILKSCVTDLYLKRLGKTVTRQELFGGQKASLKSHGVYNLKLRSTENNFEEEFKVLEIPQICGFVQSVTDVTIYESLMEKGIILTDFCKSQDDVQEIQLLLGADSWPKLMISEYL